MFRDKASSFIELWPVASSCMYSTKVPFLRRKKNISAHHYETDYKENRLKTDNGALAHMYVCMSLSTLKMDPDARRRSP